MGNKGAKLSPRTIEELQRHLGADLSDEEIKIWYNDYQESLTPGKNQLTRKDFTEVYDKLFSGDAKEFAEHVFRTFDADGNGSVDFQEFAVGLFVSSCQDLDKKLDWAFRVYDINGDGYITKDEMAKIVTVSGAFYSIGMNGVLFTSSVGYTLAEKFKKNTQMNIKMTLLVM